MSHPVAVTVTGLLMQHGRYLGSQVIGMSLITKLSILSPQLILAKDGRELCSFRRGPRIVRRNDPFLLRSSPRSRHGQGNQEKKSQCQSALPHKSGSSFQVLCYCNPNPAAVVVRGYCQVFGESISTPEPRSV